MKHLVFVDSADTLSDPRIVLYDEVVALVNPEGLSWEHLVATMIHLGYTLQPDMVTIIVNADMVTDHMTLQETLYEIAVRLSTPTSVQGILVLCEEHICHVCPEFVRAQANGCGGH